MMQSGLFTVWQKDFWPKPNECTEGGGIALGSGPRALQLKILYGHFLILSIGFLCSTICYVIEVIQQRTSFNTSKATNQN